MVDIGGELRGRSKPLRRAVAHRRSRWEYGRWRSATPPRDSAPITPSSGHHFGQLSPLLSQQEGEKVVHVEPTTGYSCPSNLLSATVLAPTCALADAYATMFMAAGDEHAERLADKIEDCAVYLIYDNESSEGGEYREYISPKMVEMMMN